MLCHRGCQFSLGLGKTFQGPFEQSIFYLPSHRIFHVQNFGFKTTIFLLHYLEDNSNFFHAINQAIVEQKLNLCRKFQNFVRAKGYVSIQGMTRLAKLLLSFMTFAPAAAFGSMARTTTIGTPLSIKANTDLSRNLRLHNRLHQSDLHLSLSNIMNVPRGGAIASIADAAKNWNSSPAAFFNSSLITLAILTAAFKVYQRASASSDKSGSVPTKPKSVKELQIKFLAVFWLLRCADWLQGPYFYEVYASKIFNGVPASLALVSKLFLTGFASTALFGPSVGRALDTYGRKKGTLAFAAIYALGAFSTKSPLLQVLFLGRVMSGIGTSLLFSAPESWLVGEAQESGDDPDGSWLGETFGLVSSHCGSVTLFGV